MTGLKKSKYKVVRLGGNCPTSTKISVFFTEGTEPACLNADGNGFLRIDDLSCLKGYKVVKYTPCFSVGNRGYEKPQILLAKAKDEEFMPLQISTTKNERTLCHTFECKKFCTPKTFIEVVKWQAL